MNRISDHYGSTLEATRLCSHCLSPLDVATVRTLRNGQAVDLCEPCADLSADEACGVRGGMRVVAAAVILSACVLIGAAVLIWGWLS